MTKQRMIAQVIATDVDKYLEMKVCDVQKEIGKILAAKFEERGWSNGDGVVYGTLLTMAMEMRHETI